MEMRDLFERVEELDIIDVASSVLGLRMTRRGCRYECLCPNPYHNDKHLGSFSIRQDTKVWGCFACDMGQHRGNSSLVSAVLGCTWSEAAVKIAVQFGIITSAEADEMLAGWRFKRRPAGLGHSTQPPIPSVQKKTPDELDVIYRCFVKASPKMTDEYKAQLIAERHLCEGDLDDFFVFPDKSTAFWQKFKQELAAAEVKGTLTEVLKGVPGFGRYKSNNRWTFVGTAGNLGLISRDAEGRIVGMQLRHKTADHGSRYSGFSSGSMDSAKFDDFCSSGSICGVERPEKPSRVIAITEGKFKALTLKKMGIWAISVSGVTNYKPVFGICEQLIKQVEKPPRFLISYDMDIKTNKAVAKAARALALELRKRFPDSEVFFADWDPDYGKGIDDVVNAGHRDKLTTVPMEDYLKRDIFSTFKN